MARAGNGPRKAHLPLIVTEVGGSTDEGPMGHTGGRTKKGSHGPTPAHLHSSKSCFYVLRELVDE